MTRPTEGNFLICNAYLGKLYDSPKGLATATEIHATPTSKTVENTALIYMLKETLKSVDNANQAFKSGNSQLQDGTLRIKKGNSVSCNRALYI